MKTSSTFVLWTLSIVKYQIIHATLVGLRWNKSISNFQSISQFSSYEDERRRIILQSRKEETHNFNLDPLNITYYEDSGFFQFYDNDTKANGIVGDIWSVLANALNFTMILKKTSHTYVGRTYPNKTYGGILEWARLNQIDVIPKITAYVTRIHAVEFTPAFWMNRQRIFSPAQWKQNYDWMFRIFPVEVRFLIIVIIVTMSLLSILTEKILIRYRYRNLQRQSNMDHFFYVFSTAANQGTVSDVQVGSRILALTINIFAMLTLTSYSSHLTYSMRQNVFTPPFTDLETLYAQTKFKILVLDGTIGHNTFTSPTSAPIFKQLFKANRVEIISDADDLYRAICTNPDKYVMFDGEDSVKVRGMRICRLYPIGTSYYMTPVTSGISRRVKNKRSFDIGIMKLFEFGIIYAIKKRYVGIHDSGYEIRKSKSSIIDLDRVFFILAVFMCGVVASIVICAIENIIFAAKESRRTTRVSQRKKY